MNQKGVLILAFAASLAASAIVSATASAEKPEFIQCAEVVNEKGNTSHWVGSLCEKAAKEKEKNSYTEVHIEITNPKEKEAKLVSCQEAVKEQNPGDWDNNKCEGTPKEQLSSYSKVFTRHTFTSTSGVTKMKAGETSIECKEDTDKGEVATSKTLKLIITLKGCKATRKAEKCDVKSTGAPNKDEIITNELTGELGYTNVGKTEVGLDLKPSVGTSFVKLEGSCIPTEKQSVEGGVIGEVQPLNSYSKTGKIVYLFSGEKQALREIEIGGKKIKDVLTVFGVGETPLETTDTITFEDAVKIVA
jgi:hypothetical protein